MTPLPLVLLPRHCRPLGLPQCAFRARPSLQRWMFTRFGQSGAVMFHQMMHDAGRKLDSSTGVDKTLHQGRLTVVSGAANTQMRVPHP